MTHRDNLVAELKGAGYQGQEKVNGCGQVPILWGGRGEIGGWRTKIICVLTSSGTIPGKASQDRKRKECACTIMCVEGKGDTPTIKAIRVIEGISQAQ